ncbi:MAG: 1-acyl-sn-glycerol-3-phosphate acyltransferase [Bryobacterales bacterium]|jgi:1-acyl-sn-glycerol-3-phosphate acyltransferase|nr:1-acyl-sn-glycerol-3-phosphate acyltransferase [Bryobacterales bacterium]
MQVTVLGPEGPLKRALRDEAARAGWVESEDAAAVVCLAPDAVDAALQRPGLRRLVVRSTAYVYGSSDKNPGLMTEERVSLLPDNAPEQRWLRAEERALSFPNTAVLRLTNILAPEEGDFVVRQLASRIGRAVAGRDPNVQFLSLGDAARAFVAALQSDATGIFNIAGDGAIPLKKAYKAAGVIRLPGLAVGPTRALEFNWTVSAERAARELGFRAEKSTRQALAGFLDGRARPGLLDRSYDDFGLDLDYIRAWGAWFWFLRNVYWRIDFEGLENIPATGRAMYVSNHRGFMPLDAVMHLSLVLAQRERVIRFLIIPSLLRMPFLSNFLTKLGGVIANQVNAERLFNDEDLVGIFPEGIRGAFSRRPYAYKVRDFARSAFAKIAIENQAPLVLSTVVGHWEIFPIIGRIDSTWFSKTYGWPYVPIAPMFPLAPIPIPSKWHVRVLPPIPVSGLRREDAENPRLVKEFANYVQAVMQRNLDDMRGKRRSIFWGRVLDGTAPPAPAFESKSVAP